MKYEIRRSRRKTVGLEITGDGLLVRAPIGASKKDVERIIADRREWFEKRMAKREQTMGAARQKGLLTEADIASLGSGYMRVFYFLPMKTIHLDGLWV